MATYLGILGALGAGIAASYGRELEAHRRPDRHWWVRRLLIVPLLAIASTAATELFGLSKSGAAFMAAMLALGGYDAIRLIEAKWRHRIGHAATTSLSAGESDELFSRD
jgi:thiamine monophosphate synthase